MFNVYTNTLPPKTDINGHFLKIINKLTMIITCIESIKHALQTHRFMIVYL